MGMSADADIFYGYVWDSEPDSPPWPDYDEETDEELEEFDKDSFIVKLLKERGHVNPLDSCPDRGYKEWAPLHRDELDAWRALQEQTEIELGFDKIDIVFFGSMESDYTTPCIAIAESMLDADWATPLALDLELLAHSTSENKERWDAQLARFVEITGADLTDAQGPGWFVTCSWG